MIKILKLITKNSLINTTKFLILFSIVFTNNIFAEVLKTENFFNNDIPKNNFNFIVIGHGYGSPGPSMYPAASLLSGIDVLNYHNPEFIIFLGDTIQHAESRTEIFGYNSKDILNKIEFSLFEKSFVNKVNAKIINIAGNHDDYLSDEYKNTFGNSKFKLNNGNDAYLGFNSMELCSNFSNLNFVKVSLNEFLENEDIKNIFLFTHQVLYSLHTEDLSLLNSLVNGGVTSCKNYSDIVRPLINKLAVEKNIYFFAGDIGCKSYKLGQIPIDSFPIFYEKLNNIHFLATGLCENNNDNFIKVLNNNNKISIKAHSLIDDSEIKIDKYDLEFWTKHYQIRDTESIKNNTLSQINSNNEGQSLLYRILSSHKFVFYINKSRSIIKSKTFFVGFIFGILISMLLLFMYVFKSKRRKL